MTTPIHPVIIGGGIIGLSTAYYLLSTSLPQGSTVTIIERNAIAHAASGRAMGMIGREWQSRHALPLSRLSWELYKDLAEEHAEEMEWIERSTLGVEVEEGIKLSSYRNIEKKGQGGRQEVWNGRAYEMDKGDSVAVVNPSKFCHLLHRLSTALGLQTIIANPTSVSCSSTDGSTLHLEPSRTSSTDVSPPLSIPFTHLVLSAGPWTAPLAQTLKLPVPAVGNLPGHSVHIRPAIGGWDDDLIGRNVFAGVSTDEDAAAALGDIAWHGGNEQDSEDSRDGGLTPSIELVTRPDGLVYVAGENSLPIASSSISKTSLPNILPEDPSDVVNLVSPRLVRRLLRSARALSPALDIGGGAEIVHSQLCYRPTSPDGIPLLGWLDQKKKVLVAAGHGPWGITLGPASGKVMAGMVRGEKPIVPMRPFRPERFAFR